MSHAERRCDVVVIGGGSAGIAAALSAARRGADTLLLERHGCLGGMGTAALVHSFCGLYLLREEPGAVLANPGIPCEIAERMIAATGIGPQRMGRVDVLPQHPVEFARIADELTGAERNLELSFHSELIGLERDADTWLLRVACRGGIHAVQARALVDASGDAVAAAFLDAETAMADPGILQRPAYIFGVCCPHLGAGHDPLRLAGRIVEGVRSGDVPEAALGLQFRTSGRPHELFGTIDLAGGPDYSPLDPPALAVLETTGRAVAVSVVRWLASAEPSWHDAYISHWPQRAGVRESRRWVGEATLTGDNLLQGRRFDDEVALATWPMEFRETNRGPKLRFPEGNLPCGIPAGCLRPRGIDRLFTAGRCISTDHDAQASIRVMGTCFATGEAAGAMAASC